jgi:hypothetical protein
MQNARNIVVDIFASLKRMRMPLKAKEIVEAETLENPEMFVRNSLGHFSAKAPRPGRGRPAPLQTHRQKSPRRSAAATRARGGPVTAGRRDHEIEGRAEGRELGEGEAAAVPLNHSHGELRLAGEWRLAGGPRAEMELKRKFRFQARNGATAKWGNCVSLVPSTETLSTREATYLRRSSGIGLRWTQE